MLGSGCSSRGGSGLGIRLRPGDTDRVPQFSWRHRAGPHTVEVWADSESLGVRAVRSPGMPGWLAGLRARLLALVLLAFAPALGLILYTASDQRRVAACRRR